MNAENADFSFLVPRLSLLVRVLFQTVGLLKVVI